MALEKVINTLARLAGWSPVGKPIWLRIDDTLETALKNHKFSGKLTVLNKDGTGMIELETPLVLEKGTITQVLAVPRHKDYNFYYLCWGFIGVDLINCNVAHDVTTEQAGAWFAVASMKIKSSGVKY